MTRLEMETIKAIKQWCIDNKMPTKGRLRHIFPRAYVLGRSAPSCLLVATPLIDAEPQMKKIRFNGEDGSMSVHLFDKTLKAGDWCSVAYVCFSGSQQQVAIKAVGK